MLRESVQTGGGEVDVQDVTRGFGEGAPVPHAALLAAFAEAVVVDDRAGMDAARQALRPAIGDAGVVDAAAVVGAFHGFVRIADAIGIPWENASGGKDLPELRERAGVNAFHRVRGEALPP